MAESSYAIRSADGAEFPWSLHAWLESDRSLPDGTQVRWNQQRDDHAPDGATQACSWVEVLLPTTLELPALIDSVRRWFRARPDRTPPIVFEHDDTRFEVHCAEDLDRLARSLAKFDAQPAHQVTENP
ncbi:hypothetical protein [Streptomyces sp. NPDC047108]|uniref:effector-associated constant component EACC1 n=1 Tax=Streptomyces sp. NPDC047108 TaxID=3155025 RepID=UPI0033C79ADB